MYVIADLQATVHVWCVRKFMIYVHTKLHMPSSSYSIGYHHETDSERNILQSCYIVILHFTKKNSLIKVAFF
jgi:hypothetical protein